MRTLLVVVCGALCLHEAAPAAAADEWIVDDSSATVHLMGSWVRRTTTPGFYGADYLAHGPGTSAALVRWPFPATGAPGQYRVYVRYTSGQNRTASAVYHVDSSDTSADVSINQQTGGGTWHSLGTFTFEPRRGEEVSLSSAADGVVVADAVAWVGAQTTSASRDLADSASGASEQTAVNGGDQPWRLDPLAVVHAEADTLGFAPDDPMRLATLSDGTAMVRVQHASDAYDIHLSQPGQTGPTGIWVVDSMHRVDPSSR